MKFQIKQNDTKPWLVVQLMDFVGTESEKPINLTAEEIKKVRFIMRETKRTDVEGPSFKKDAIMTEPVAGIVTYKWGAGDTAVSGLFNGEFELEDEDGDIETIPRSGYIEIEITDDLG